MQKIFAKYVKYGKSPERFTKILVTNAKKYEQTRVLLKAYPLKKQPNDLRLNPYQKKFLALLKDVSVILQKLHPKYLLIYTMNIPCELVRVICRLINSQFWISSSSPSESLLLFAEIAII